MDRSFRVVLMVVVMGWVLCAGLLLFDVADASAHYEPVGLFDKGGLTGSSEGVAVNYSTGEFYVADGFNGRVLRFDSHGGLLGAWGWNTVATGPDKVGKDQTEEIVVKATAGTFTLNYSPGGKTASSETGELNWNEPAEKIEVALDHLSGIESQKGRVKVEGLSGVGETTYKLTYEEGVGDEQQAPIVPVDKSLTGTIEVTNGEEGVPAFEDCVVAEGDVCRESHGEVAAARGEGGGEFIDAVGVAVDRATGDVYVLDRDRSVGSVQVFSSDGQVLIGSFGQQTGEPLEEHSPEPEKDPEGLRFPASIAVDPSGVVYIVDRGRDVSSGGESRVAVFRPAVAGVFTEYLYEEAIARRCGQAASSFCGARHVALDSSGAVHVSNAEKVFEFEPGKSGMPVCESVSHVDLEGMAAPGAGETVVYSEKENTFFWLEKCVDNKSRSFRGYNEGGVKESETEGLAIDPSMRFEGGRPPGILYALSPGALKGELNAGIVFVPSVAASPKVLPGSESVSLVGVAHARLGARIATRGNPTHYVFQYSTESTELCSEVHRCGEAPVGGGLLGAEAKEEDAAVTVGGLSPETVYHFRVVGYSNCNAEDPGERCLLEGGSDREFETFASSAGLPDGRAYELVSPALKPGGGDVFPPSPFTVNCAEGCLPGVGNEHFPMQSTTNGDAMVYEGGPFAVTGDAADENEYLATRTEGGWQTRGISPELELKNGLLTGYKAVSPDLSRGVFAQVGRALCPEAGEEGYADLYLFGGDCEGRPGLQPLLTVATPHLRTPSEFKLVFAGGAEDLGSVVFEANDALTEETAVAPAAQDGGASANNLYEWRNGGLLLVNVLPGNSSTQPNATLGSGFEAAQPTLGAPDFSHAVSRDGSRIFWTDRATKQVYVRENGTETKAIKDGGGFLTASVDGSEVLLSDGHLYSLEAEGVMADLTQGKGGFVGILGASEDLSRVYFVDTAGLAGAATPGQPNLYYWTEGTVRFIGTLNPKDGFNGAALSLVASSTSDWAASPSDRTAQVTADGTYLAFMSFAQLTPSENSIASGECVPGTSSPLCDEVYEYDANTGGLTCVSCNPTGERPLGPSALSLIYPEEKFMSQPANLSENGRVFFDSFDTLSPQDDSPGVEKVYEYEPDGLGSCRREGGCIYLISSGTSETDSSFVNATPSGSDVFFTTRSQLVPEDRDDLMDLYDAREGGGFPPSPQPHGCATSETCQGGPQSPPSSVEAPVSGGVSGNGNLAPSTTSPSPSPRSSSPTRAQRLAKALVACHRQRNRSKRAACEARARKLYGVVVKHTKAKKARVERRGR